MLRRLIYFLIVGTFALNANAQSAHYASGFSQMFAFAWDVNIPINNNFTNKVSWDGFKLEYRKMVTHNLSVGTEINWAGYKEYYPTKTYQIPNGAITSDFYTYIYTLPLAVNVHHYFEAGKMIKPYVGLALGAMYSEQRIYYNTYYSNDYNWGFLVRPELGAIFRFSENSNVGLLVGARYSYATNKQSTFKINGLQSVGFQLGIVFMQ